MFFGDGVEAGALFGLLGHPPAARRAHPAHRPGFDGSFPAITYPEQSAAAAAAEEAEQPSPIERATALAGAAVAALAAARRGDDPRLAAEAAIAGTEPVTPASVAERVGTLSDAHLAYAAALLDALPPGVREAAHEPEGAEAVVYSLLLDRDPAVRDVQLALLRERAEPAAFARVEELRERIAACPVAARLPLVDMALPALGRLSLGRHEGFLATVEALVAADRRIDLFEYTLQRLLASHLVPRYQPRPPRPPHYYKLGKLGRECSLLLSALVHSGHGTADDARRAFERAAAELPEGIDGLALVPREECGMAAVDAALAELDRTTPNLKRDLVRAATAAVAFDGRVTVAEGELLRAVADSLGCPVPPFLPGQMAA